MLLSASYHRELGTEGQESGQTRRDKGFAGVIREHWRGIVMGSLGWITLGAYLFDEYAEHGSLSEFYEHQIAETPIHHVLMFLMIPIMMAFGYIFEKRRELERELKGYTGQLEQKVWATATELTASEERYRSLVETANDAIITSDGQANVVFWNRAAEAVFGHSADEIVGKPLTTIIPERFREDYKKETKKMVSTGEPDIIGKTVEFAGVRKDGTEFPAEVSITNWETEEGTFHTSIIRDITKRKHAEEEIERNYEIQGVINSVLQISMEPIPLEGQLERILDILLSIPWIVFKKKGAIFLVEDDPDVLVMKAQRGLHEALTSTCGKLPFGRCICGRAAASKEIVFVDRVDERHENTYQGIMLHGHYCVPILSGERVLGVLNLYVKEGYKRDEKEEAFLRSVANTLAGIIERKKAGDALEDAYEQLKDVDRIKDDIISNVSHELRTPITIVKGAMEIARDEEDAEARNKLYDVVIDALAKQNRIVGNLIEMAQVQKKKFELSIKEVELNHVVSMVVGEIKREAEGKEIKIDSDVPDIGVWADFEEIKHVFLNLLDNSVKFTDFGGHIKISARVKDGKAEVCVEDTGIGIPEEFHEKVFDRLFQVDATTTRRFAGTGMGLAVAREIVEAYGGKIWVKSKKEGSRLCFTLPLSKKG